MRDPGSGIRDSVLFFELFLDRRTEASGRAERFAVVVQRKSGDMDRLRARGGLLLDDDGHRAAFDAVAKRKAAAAGETRVGKTFEHLP